jgi:hypothetical protein
MAFDLTFDRFQTEQVPDNIEHIIPCGTELLLSPVFNEMGFNSV